MGTSCIIFSFAATISVACSFGGIAACDEEDFKLSALKRTVAQNPCPFWQYSGDNPTSRKPDFRSDLQQDVPTCPCGSDRHFRCRSLKRTSLFPCLQPHLNLSGRNLHHNCFHENPPSSYLLSWQSF